MRAAYADPPYLGQAKRHYRDDPQCAEVDHAQLIERLQGYDAWALSCSSPSLKTLLALCPDDVRILAWVKPFCVFKPGVDPAYAWEPIIVRGGRRRRREQQTVRDWFMHNIVSHAGVAGAKPYRLCQWLFEVLNLEPQDDFHDLFPGSGAVGSAWEAYRERFNAATNLNLNLVYA